MDFPISDISCASALSAGLDRGWFGAVGVRVGVLSHVGSVQIYRPSSQSAYKRPDVRAVAGEAYYRLNGDDKSPLEIVAHRTGNEYFAFAMPPPISTYEFRMSGGTLTPAAAEKIEAGEDDVHTLYLPLIVNGEPITIDLTFSLGIKTRRIAAAPGMP